MVIQLAYNGIDYRVNLEKGNDISIPLSSEVRGPKCFYAPDFRISPVVSGEFIGSTESGSPVNFNNIFINPHGNGTHTECVGHISSRSVTIHQCLKNFHFIANLITVVPQKSDNGDEVITESVIRSAIPEAKGPLVLIIRTLPNNESKTSRDYSGTNPSYFSKEAIEYINKIGIRHLMTDLPSIDREVDGGALASHKAFWGYPSFVEVDKTITEMVYVSDHIKDGTYFCNIQILSVESDASPSKIILYDLEKC